MLIQFPFIQHYRTDLETGQTVLVWEINGERWEINGEPWTVTLNG